MHTQNPSDEKMIKRLQLLRQVPPRDPEAAQSGRARFLAQVESLRGGGSRPEEQRHTGWYEKAIPILPRKERFSIVPLLTSILIALVLFFGGAGATTFASQNALPGDTLYPVKTAAEDLRLAMTASTTSEARLYNDFVQRRVDEIDSLAEKGRYSDIPVAASRLENQVRQVAKVLTALAGEDPAQAQQISTRLRESLSVQVQLKDHIRNGQAEFEFLGIVETMNANDWTISGEVVSVGPDAQIEGDIEAGDLVKVKAMVAEDGSLTAVTIRSIDGRGRDAFNLAGIVESMDGDGWVVAGRTIHVTPQTMVKDPVVVGDFIEIEGVLAIDGSMVARTIRLADDGNSNSNGNGNDNDNLNGNLNENGNENDENSNDNLNENGNDDDHNGNLNENDDGDDNENCNGDGCIGDDNANDHGSCDHEDCEENGNGNEQIGNDNNDNGSCDHEECEGNENNHQGNDNGNEDNGNGDDHQEDGNENGGGDGHEDNENEHEGMQQLRDWTFFG